MAKPVKETKTEAAQAASEAQAVQAAPVIPTIPGVIRKPFVLKSTGEIRNSYHIEFQRGSRDKFTVDLRTQKEKGDTDASAYRTLDDIFDGVEHIEAFPVYLDGMGNFVKSDDINARIAVEVRGTNIIMGEKIDVKSILVADTKEHRRALEEYFKVKNLILKKSFAQKRQADTATEAVSVTPDETSDTPVSA